MLIYLFFPLELEGLVPFLQKFHVSEFSCHSLLTLFLSSSTVWTWGHYLFLSQTYFVFSGSLEQFLRDSICLHLSPGFWWKPVEIIELKCRENCPGMVSCTQLLLINMDVLNQLFWSLGPWVLGPTTGASLRQVICISSHKRSFCHVTLEKTQIYKNQWAIENDNG